MQFRVPQFIEYETKLVGPLTVRQAIYILLPAFVSFLIYLAIGKTKFFLSLFLAFLLIGTGAALAFVKIEGRTLPTVFLNFFKHTVKPRRYLWKKPEKTILTFEIKKYEPKKIEESPLQIPESSRLRKARIKVETQTR